jgi:peptidoglycan hydrolase-like protein with peptidoglycan-binding domain
VVEPVSAVTTPDWGYRRVRINGRDRTYVRGVRTKIGDMAWAEPYGEMTLGLSFPAISHWDLRDGTFPWLAKGARVTITHHDASMAFVKELGRWRVTDLDVSGGQVTVLCQGALAAGLALRQNNPSPFPRKKPVDIGRLIYRVVPKGFLGNQIPSIGVNSTVRGSINQTRIEYLDELLDSAFDSTGQWTVARHATIPGRYQVRRKDMTGTDATITLLPGTAITWDLRTDVMATPTAIYGQWETPVGRRGRNVLLPNKDDDRPPYAGPYSLGDSGEDIEVITRELWTQGYQDDTTDYRGAKFTADVRDAVEDAQKNAGIAVTGTVNERTWNALFSGLARNGGQARGATFAPLDKVDATSRFLRSTNGSVRGYNPDYNRRLLRVEEFIDYGSGIARKQVVRHSRRIINRYGQTAWFGSITLDGVDPPEMHRLDIREGMNVTLVGLPGDPLAHVAKVTHSGDESPKVTLEVDTAGRDARTLAMLKRRYRDPDAIMRRKERLARKSQNVNDRYSFWDEESGAGIFRVDGVGGRWRVQRIFGGVVDGVTRINATCLDYTAGSRVSSGVTADKATDTIEKNAHGLANGDLVVFVDKTGAEGLRLNQWYYVVNRSTDDFQVSLVKGGAPERFRTDGTGLTYRRLVEGSERAFVLALFGSRVTVKELNRHVGNPTVKQSQGGQSYDPFNTPRDRDWRDRRNLIEAWGRPSQLAGYSPGEQSSGHPITGRLRDSGLWHAESNAVPYLWAAVYVVGGDGVVDGTFRVLEQP